MAGGREGPSACTRLVDGCGIRVSLPELVLLPWLEVDDGEGVKQDLGVGLSYHHLLPVPPSSIQKQALERKPATQDNVSVIKYHYSQSIGGELNFVDGWFGKKTTKLNSTNTFPSTDVMGDHKQ